MLDQMLTPPADESAGGWGLPKRPVAGDSGYGDATEFRLGLTSLQADGRSGAARFAGGEGRHGQFPD